MQRCEQGWVLWHPSKEALRDLTMQSTNRTSIEGGRQTVSARESGCTRKRHKLSTGRVMNEFKWRSPYEATGDGAGL